MLTVRATLEPNDHLCLPEPVRRERPVQVLVTFLDDAEAPVTGSGHAAATLALLQSSAFRDLPKSTTAEIEQRIAELRGDWKDD